MELLVAAAVLVCATGPAPSAPDVSALVALINNAKADWEARADAEAQLKACSDPQVIEAIWETLQQSVVLELNASEPEVMPPDAVAAFQPCAPAAELSEGLPVGAQIVHARLRVWAAVTRSAGARNERSAILNDLLMREQSSFSRQLVLSACMANWSEALAGTVDALVRDQTEECWVRQYAVYLFMVHEPDRFADLVDLAWQERGEACADAVSRWLTRTESAAQPRYDVRVVLLRIDAFERLRLQEDVVNAGLLVDDLRRYATLNISDAGSAEAPVGTAEWYERMCRDLETWIEANRQQLEAEAAAWKERAATRHGQRARSPGEVAALIASVNDPDTHPRERAWAESSLISCADARVLKEIWACLEDPVPFGTQFEFVDGRLVPTDRPAEVHPQAVVALVPGGGSAEIDSGLPVGAQIVYARLRIWNALTRSAGTAADRSAILLDLLSRDQGEFAKVTVLRACMQNWSAGIGRAVESVALDAAETCRVRSEAFRLLMVRQPDSFPKLVDTVWLERHTPCVDTLSKHLTQTRVGMNPRYDARVMLLRVDAFRTCLPSDRTRAVQIAVELNAYGKLGIDRAASPAAPEGNDAWRARSIRDMQAWIDGNIGRLELEAARAADAGGS